MTAAWYRAIVFTRTKHGANKVARQLNASGFAAEVIHGNKSQAARQRALENFKSGDAWVLVATDIAARGIDIREVSHVFNYELPHEPESYVHRIGRTARAGAGSIAWALVDAAEISRLKAIQRLTKLTLEPVTLDIELPDNVITKPASAARRVEKTEQRRRRQSQPPTLATTQTNERRARQRQNCRESNWEQRQSSRARGKRLQAGSQRKPTRRQQCQRGPIRRTTARQWQTQISRTERARRRRQSTAAAATTFHQPRC